MTAMGVGMMAGLTSGYYDSMEEVKSLYQSSSVYKPRRSSLEARQLLQEYKRAVHAAEVSSAKGQNK